MKDNATTKLNFKYKNNKTSVDINSLLVNLYSSIFHKNETEKKQRQELQKFLTEYFFYREYNSNYTNKINIENVIISEIQKLII